MADGFGAIDSLGVRGGFFSPVKRRIATASSGPGGVGIVVSPDKKATLAEAAAKAENVLDNDAKAKQQAALATNTAMPLARQSPLRSSTAAAAAASSPRAKRSATPTATPNNKKRATAVSTPVAAAAVSSPVRVVAESASAAAAELQAESAVVAAKNAEIERLELEFFHALFLALKLSLVEQHARFNNKIDAADLLASARRQNVPFTTPALTGFIDRQLRIATRANSRQSMKK